MRVNNSQHKYFYHDGSNSNHFFMTGKIFTPIISKSGDIAIQSEQNIFFKSEGPTLGTRPGDSFSYDFFLGKIFWKTLNNIRTPSS